MDQDPNASMHFDPAEVPLPSLYEEDLRRLCNLPTDQSAMAYLTDACTRKEFKFDHKAITRLIGITLLNDRHAVAECAGVLLEQTRIAKRVAAEYEKLTQRGHSHELSIRQLQTQNKALTSRLHTSNLLVNDLSARAIHLEQQVTTAVGELDGLTQDVQKATLGHIGEPDSQPPPIFGPPLAVSPPGDDLNAPELPSSTALCGLPSRVLGQLPRFGSQHHTHWKHWSDLFEIYCAAFNVDKAKWADVAMFHMEGPAHTRYQRHLTSIKDSGQTPSWDALKIDFAGLFSTESDKSKNAERFDSLQLPSQPVMSNILTFFDSMVTSYEGMGNLQDHNPRGAFKIIISRLPASLQQTVETDRLVHPDNYPSQASLSDLVRAAAGALTHSLGVLHKGLATANAASVLVAGHRQAIQDRPQRRAAILPAGPPPAPKRARCNGLDYSIGRAPDPPC